MSTAEVGRLGLMAKEFADGPHGVREDNDENSTSFPNLCLVGSTWDTELVNKMGIALAKECIVHGVDMILGPGVNVKRHILCGRNFEYFSEDPVLAGEMAAAYINGVQSLGVATSLKHFAANNQEKYRDVISVDVDIRTLMEIYLKAFEIAIKKSSPVSVMCAYNKLHSIWCSENKFLLTEVLRDMWGYDGIVVSDWNAVHDASRAFSAGLDLQMPENKDILEDIKNGLKKGYITLDDINRAVRRMIEFLLVRPETNVDYDRDEQHKIARDVASSGIVLLKNDDNALPITKDKYRKIAVIGEFAKSPIINGHGSAEVYPRDEYVDSPFDELQKNLCDTVELKYMEIYKKASFSQGTLWRKVGEYTEFIKDVDTVLLFIGAMESEASEQFDRRTAEFNPCYEMFIDHAIESGKKVIVVMQSGSAMILGDWRNKVDAIVQMWLGGESSGGAIADVLCGVVNPSGKLSETFPTKLRTDLEYPGNGYTVEYSEKHLVGYRYYDLHPEEVVYPFGYGLSYTTFDYSNLNVSRIDGTLEISCDISNTGKLKGAEVVQLYVGDPVSTVARPVKELKGFDKIELEPGETKKVIFNIDVKDIGYYNVLLREWVTEPGEYIIYVGASSADIKLKETISIEDDAPYTVLQAGEAMIG